jgi:hypothetical protein
MIVSLVIPVGESIQQDQTEIQSFRLFLDTRLILLDAFARGYDNQTDSINRH